MTGIGWASTSISDDVSLIIETDGLTDPWLPAARGEIFFDMSVCQLFFSSADLAQGFMMTMTMLVAVKTTLRRLLSDMTST